MKIIRVSEQTEYIGIPPPHYNSGILIVKIKRFFFDVTAVSLQAVNENESP